MNIVVTIKKVEDPIIPPSHMVLDPSGKRAISVSKAPQVMNGYDANALEEAIRLKEKHGGRSEEHTSELQSHSFISYAVFCLKKNKKLPTRSSGAAGCQNEHMTALQATG